MNCIYCNNELSNIQIDINQSKISSGWIYDHCKNETTNREIIENEVLDKIKKIHIQPERLSEKTSEEDAIV